MIRMSNNNNMMMKHSSSSFLTKSNRRRIHHTRTKLPVCHLLVWKIISISLLLLLLFISTRHQPTYYVVTSFRMATIIPSRQQQQQQQYHPTFNIDSLLLPPLSLSSKCKSTRNEMIDNRSKSIVCYLKPKRSFDDENNNSNNKNDYSSLEKKNVDTEHNNINKQFRYWIGIVWFTCSILSFGLSSTTPVFAVDETSTATTTTTTTTLPSPVTVSTTTTDSTTTASSSTTSKSKLSSTIIASDSFPKLGFVQDRKYWTIQNEGTVEEKIIANKALLEHVVRTVNTVYYDRTGGIEFTPEAYYSSFRTFLRTNLHLLSTREGTVSILKTYLIHPNTLPDIFARYLTREELKKELITRNDGFLGLGAIVEMPGSNPFIEDTSSVANPSENNNKKVRKVTESLSFIRNNHYTYLTSDTAENLPIITAVVPLSPAERAGLTVGDRIVAVQDDSFLSLNKQMVLMKLQQQYSAEQNQYFGYTELTVAKPITIYKHATTSSTGTSSSVSENDISSFTSTTGSSSAGSISGRIDLLNENDYEITAAADTIFRPTRVRLSTVAASRSTMYADNNNNINNFQEQQLPDKNNAVQVPSSVLIAESSTSPLSAEESADGVNAALPSNNNINNLAALSGGNDIVRWQLLTGQGSIFIDKRGEDQEPLLFNNDMQQLVSFGENNINNGNVGNDVEFTSLTNEVVADGPCTDNNVVTDGVGYIRLTRFSRAAITGFVEAVNELEGLGAQSYIIDLRNNYGGYVQSAMMLASSLLRDPHDILCYIMNNRCGFTPVAVGEFVLDKYYPGYLLSRESSESTLNQVKEENPAFFENNDRAQPSSYDSLREQFLKRGNRKSASSRTSTDSISSLSPAEQTRLRQIQAQKPIVLLVNEGTASSAEVFAAALRDNGRSVALVGAKTYGKGLIQHTYPLPDGGGLRLTVAEYLTPSQRHVSRVGRAQFDPRTGEWVGGGLRPDIVCDSKQGIPSNIGADLCVGMALDALEEYSQ